jgi:hypothetical protein
VYGGKSPLEWSLCLSPKKTGPAHSSVGRCHAYHYLEGARLAPCQGGHWVWPLHSERERSEIVTLSGLLSVMAKLNACLTVPSTNVEHPLIICRMIILVVSSEHATSPEALYITSILDSIP